MAGHSSQQLLSFIHSQSRQWEVDLTLWGLQLTGPLAQHRPDAQPRLINYCIDIGARKAWSHYGAAPTDIIWMKWTEAISEIKEWGEENVTGMHFKGTIFWWKMLETFQCLSDFIQNWDVPITVLYSSTSSKIPLSLSILISWMFCRSNPALLERYTIDSISWGFCLYFCLHSFLLYLD